MPWAFEGLHEGGDARAHAALGLRRALADEEVVDLLVDVGGAEEPRERLLRVDVARAQHAERGEEVQGVEAHEHRVASAHGQAGERAALGIAAHGVLALHQRKDVLPQLRLEELEGQLHVLRVVAVHDLVVGDDHHHRHGLPLGDQVVQDEVRAPVVDPVRGQLAAASDEVEHGVGLGAVVAGRRVDVELALAAGDVGMIDVARHRAVRDVAGVVVGGAVPVHHELAVGRHGREGRVGVARVGDLHAVHIEVVGIDVRPKRTHRQGPDAVLALREGHPGCRASRAR